ncbi:ABC transporter permease subunit [Pseudogemmobacter faecipullorum]|uniref:ABC transporter permease subunit n=1 Tax=Pseudogemmobacter faecipullorum TaxID=2755041 RepID=A0ABS8CPP0_9RHOB|nr:ABC transporter permease subunit [Pseudogemmobacter faecipullorum]MCB5410795.1 ABC transporter permease subunit [Pseudogemmobacter faecipullorum]
MSGLAEKRSSRGLDQPLGEKLFQQVVLLVPLAGLALFFLYPLAIVVWRSLQQRDGAVGAGNYREILGLDHLWGVVSNSLVMSGLTALICVSLGLVIAYALNRTRMPLRWLVSLALILPLLAPSLVQALGLIFMFGRNGLVTYLTGIELQIYGLPGLVIANSMYALPQAVMIMAVALRHADRRQYDAALVLGASPWRRFCDITLPALRFGILSAAFVCFTVTITDFGNAAVIGGNYRVLASEIYAQVVGQMNFNMGAVVGILLLIPTLLAFYLEKVAGQRGDTGEGAIPVEPDRWAPRDLPLWIITHLTALFLIAIVAVVVFASFVQLWPYKMSLTLKNYNITTQGGFDPLWTSLYASLITAVFGTIMLFALVLAQRKMPRSSARLVYLLAIIPVGVPGLVLGLSYVLAFNVKPVFPGILYGSALLIAFCNFYHYHSQGFLTMVTGIRNVPKQLEETVTTIGGGTWASLRDAIIPIMVPTLISVFFFLFMRGMVTLSAVIFLITPKLSVGAVSVMRLDQAGSSTQAAAFSVLIMLTVLAAMGLMRVILKLQARLTRSTGAS